MSQSTTAVNRRRFRGPDTTIRKAAWSVLFVALTTAAGSAVAGEADIVNVKIAKTGDREYRFDVTVRHADTGWKHYADRWEVLSPDGKVLGVRVLYHPHVDEQPFTRSLSGVRIPTGVDRVTLRAGDKVHAYGGRTATVRVPK